MTIILLTTSGHELEINENEVDQSELDKVTYAEKNKLLEQQLKVCMNLNP